MKRSEHERMEIITLVEENLFLHAPYIDLFNIDQNCLQIMNQFLLIKSILTFYLGNIRKIKK